MRTKTLLCAAALAAGVATSMAQSNVYSLNVVGYVNVPTVGGGFSLIANPLNNTNNNITNIFSVAQDGDQIYRWDAGAQNLSGIIYTYSIAAHAWDGNFVLRPGEGILYLNAGNNATNTFVGEVQQGSITNPLPVLGNGSFNCLGSPVPIGASFTNAVVGINPNDGDQVYSWDPVAQNLGGQIATYSVAAHAWDDPTLVIAPGNGLFYLNTGSDQAVWVRNFTVQ